MSSPPEKPTIRYVVDRAATLRRRRYQDDERYRHFTEAAMLEQVCGQKGVLVDLGDGWWQAGVVMDAIAGVQLDVLANPGERKIRLREPAPVPDPEPPKPLLPPRQPELFRVLDERGWSRLKWDEW